MLLSVCSPETHHPSNVCPAGIERLLLLLGEKPTSSSASEGAACERVQQKAAVTLARLSRDNEVAHTAIQLKGGSKLKVSKPIGNQSVISVRIVWVLCNVSTVNFLNYT